MQLHKNKKDIDNTVEAPEDNKNLSLSEQKQESEWKVPAILLILTCGVLLLVLGVYTHELFGIVSPLFIMAATILALNTLFSSLGHSTRYLLSAIATGMLGYLFLILGMYVHMVFAKGDLLYFYAAGIFAILSIAVIIGDKEIFRASGLLKIVILILFGIMIARITVLTLQKVRETKQLPTWESSTAPVKGQEGN